MFIDPPYPYYSYCTLYVVHCTLYAVHSTSYTVHCTPYTVRCKVYTVCRTLYVVQCTFTGRVSPNNSNRYDIHTTYNLRRTTYDIRRTTYDARRTTHDVRISVVVDSDYSTYPSLCNYLKYCERCTVYSVQSTVNGVWCTVYGV